MATGERMKDVNKCDELKGSGEMEEKPECLEMAKALYQFKATIPKTFSFRESDHFIIYQASTKQRNWWQVINAKAQVGYVPSNYVTSVQVSPDFLTKFVDDCIAVLRKESDKSDGCLPNDRQEVLLKLVERKGQVEKLVESRSPTVIGSDASLSHSISSTASKISPPLLLQAKPKVKTVQSSPSFQDEAKTREKHRESERRKSEIVESRSLSSCGPIPVERCYSNDEVSEICGQVGIPLLEARKSISSVSSVSKADGEDVRVPATYRKSSHTGNNVSLTEENVYSLVEKVRCNTELSHEMSRVAVEVVASELQRYIPNSPILEKVLLIVQNPITAPKPLIEDTHDAKRLHVIFSELTSCKDDAQQRSWMLHEDEAVIIDYVKELTSILMNADTNISRHVISSDQYAGVFALAQYYQMEVRWSIRQPLLQALGVLCGLDPAVISIFLSSVLPMEVARDMKANPRNIPKLNFSAVLLTMIFSMGEAMPVTHLEHLGDDFINFLLNHIEDPPDTDVEDQIPDLFISLILSYNLQFKTPQENVVLRTVSQRSVAKTFTEKILLLLNREDDPVRIFDHEPKPPHSVLKLFIDLFSSSSSATVFYTNDVRVLIDIIVRQLADLCAGDQRRHQYLQLCRVVMRNSGYSEHHHRRDEISKSFTRIFCEETEVSLKDQQLVREISNEFPQYFK